MAKGLAVLAAALIALGCTAARAVGQAPAQVQVSARVVFVDSVQFALVREFARAELIRPASGIALGEVRVSQTVESVPDDRPGRRQRRMLTISYLRN
jgi:hypothetical protein